MKKILFLSPHSDDIALSIGGLLSRKILDSFDCYMCTVFTTSAHSPYVDCKGNINKVTEIRGKEDCCFCAMHNITYIDGGFNETTTRGYKDIDSIFQMSTPFGDPLYSKVEVFLKELLYSEPWSFIFAPAGIGNHIEHLMVREICCKYMLDKTIFYEDLPYGNDFDKLSLKKNIT